MYCRENYNVTLELTGFSLVSYVLTDRPVLRVVEARRRWVRRLWPKSVVIRFNL
jgi:hypothetical protein